MVAAPLPDGFDKLAEHRHLLHLVLSWFVQAVRGADTDAGKVHLVVQRVSAADLFDHALVDQSTVRTGIEDRYAQLRSELDLAYAEGDLVGLLRQVVSIGNADVRPLTDRGQLCTDRLIRQLR